MAIHKIVIRNYQAPLLDEVIGGPVFARLRWRGPFLLNQVLTHNSGGVYLLLNRYGTILKAGQAEKFSARSKKYLGKIYQAASMPKRPHKMYLATIQMQRAVGDNRAPNNPALVINSVERAITRTLRRAGRTLPLERNYHKPQPVVKEIQINNLLPERYANLVNLAYTGPGNRNVYPLPPGRNAGNRHLYLRRADHPQWGDELDAIVNRMI